MPLKRIAGERAGYRMHDFCVIGGGIVGLATAAELARRHRGADILLLEKENRFARHQSGHNSGVIHAGVYYKPGSLKARLCKEGARATRAFCAEHGIAFKTPGKLIVAVNSREVERLRAVERNAVENGISIRPVEKSELGRLEPNVEGERALLSPTTGIVDYGEICGALARTAADSGAEIVLNAAVDGITESGSHVTIRARDRSWQARRLIVCGGLQSDRLARMSGIEVNYRIIPFRGEYYRLRSDKTGILNHLIYPVPDPELPFLGIHFTPTMAGDVTVGPNAVLSFAREKYRKFAVDPVDFASYVTTGEFWKVIAKHWRSAVSELGNSISKHRYLANCRKYLPDLAPDDLLPYRPGIRAQAILKDGTLAQDFIFLRTERILHVGNAPSPAATSALPIARMIVDEITKKHVADDQALK